MSLTRDELIEIAVDKYFIGLNEHNVPKATDIMSEDCIMRFSAAKFRYEGRPANICLLYTSPSPRDGLLSRMPSSA